MPYIITTKRPNAGSTRVTAFSVEIGNRAAATLDEAQNYIASVVHRIDPTRNYSLRIAAIPEHGGTVGPLPDGYVIEVRKVTWTELDDMGDPREHHRFYPRDDAMRHQAIIDAYNAR